MSAPAVARIYLTVTEMKVTDTIVTDDGPYPIAELAQTLEGVAVTFDGGYGWTFRPGDAVDILPRPRESAEVQAIRTAVGLIAKYGLCRDDFESPDESPDECLCPAGAIAVAVGLPAAVWEKPHWTVQETPAYEAGMAAMYALVEAIGRWAMPPLKEWDSESLANHIGWWLEDVRPSVEQVLHQMRVAAGSLAASAEQGGGV